jgi:hypothetical protein
MSNLIIGGTIAVIILMWLLMRPDDVKNLTKSLGDLYTTTVGALVPK